MPFNSAACFDDPGFYSAVVITGRVAEELTNNDHTTIIKLIIVRFAIPLSVFIVRSL
jgi:hypothetical protein